MLCHENYFFPQCSGSCKGGTISGAGHNSWPSLPTGTRPASPRSTPVIEFLNLLLTLVQVGTQIITGGLVDLSVG